MIELSSTSAMMLYLGLTLAVLLGLWLTRHYQTRRQKIVLSAETLLVCEYCHCAYLANRAKNVTQCPQCHCFNKNNTYKS